MKLIIHTILILTISFTTLTGYAQKRQSFKPKEVYRSGALVITQLSENAFEHTSFLQTNDFGNVPCNGLVVTNSNEAIVFDTPADDKSSEELVQWLLEKLHCKINAIIPTHFHNDCLGGLKAFHNNKIPSYANFTTIELAKANNFPVPQRGFNDSLILNVGNQKVIARFLGEGHTKDNIVVYFPSEQILFGGCLIKEMNAGKGYLGDANVTDWPGTVEKVKKAYPQAKIVIPGHGEYGDKKLLDYTIKLFSEK